MGGERRKNLIFIEFSIVNFNISERGMCEVARDRGGSRGQPSGADGNGSGLEARVGRVDTNLAFADAHCKHVSGLGNPLCNSYFR
ncbi:hypothetical protein IAD21_01124 [Abditibacteriota bacterium]|nr:hypothetical protein IAD21_01124 [Abditibacteriota bacterium]